MQEKDIREKLNQELDTMAPDILNKILAAPIEPVKSEKELLGKDRALFKQKKKMKPFMWAAPAFVAVAACIIAVIMIMQPAIAPENVIEQSNVAFNIMIDVNPSISIDVNDDGTVSQIKAENKDAKKIVEKVNEKIDDTTDYNKAVKVVVKQLNKSGYLKKKKDGMLISVMSDNSNQSKDKLKEIKAETKELQENKKINCTTIYQVCENNEETLKVAEKNNVSIGKATLCMKLAAKENTSVKKMCKKSMDTLVEKAKKSGISKEEEELLDNPNIITPEDESVTSESESVLEDETESEWQEEESTVFDEETITEEQTEAGNEPAEVETFETESAME